MRELQLKQTNTKIPSIAVGCMRIDSMEIPALAQHIEFCVEQGLTYLIMRTFMAVETARHYLARHSKRRM